MMDGQHRASLIYKVGTQHGNNLSSEVYISGELDQGLGIWQRAPRAGNCSSENDGQGCGSRDNVRGFLVLCPFGAI